MDCNPNADKNSLAFAGFVAALKEIGGVSGWEFTSITESVCYYGPDGCERAYPESKVNGRRGGARDLGVRLQVFGLESYWSLIEFDVNFKRHVPYFNATIRLPIVSANASASAKRDAKAARAVKDGNIQFAAATRRRGAQFVARHKRSLRANGRARFADR